MPQPSPKVLLVDASLNAPPPETVYVAPVYTGIIILNPPERKTKEEEEKEKEKKDDEGNRES